MTRALAWVWLLLATFTGVLGGLAAYEDSSSLRIEEFSQLYLRLGLSDVFMLTVFLALPLTTALIASYIIVIRRSDDVGALVLATGLAAFFLFVSGFAGLTGLEWLGLLTSSVAMVLMAVFLASFPTGTFQPRWSILAPALVIVVSVIRPTLASETRGMLSNGVAGTDVALAAFAWGTVILVAVCAQVVRYRRISSVPEQHQSRWVMMGSLVMLLPASVLLVLITTGLSRPGLIGAFVATSAVGSYVFQGAVLIAVFRYHLYEIDRLISRTITYGMVVLAVSAVYGLLVVFLPRDLGGSNDLVIAGSTLAAAAVFNPIRVRIQRVVDRRFNRARYNSERELAAFAARLSEQVDIQLIITDIERTLVRTLEPRNLGIWIRPTG